MSLEDFVIEISLILMRNFSKSVVCKSFSFQDDYAFRKIAKEYISNGKVATS